MMLNCKQGDLAQVIKSNVGNEGLIVRCIRLHSSPNVDLDGALLKPIDNGPRWVVDPPLQRYNPLFGIFEPLYTYNDKWLRPLKKVGDDETDEMVEIIERPDAVLIDR